MKGAIFFSTRYGSTAQYARWISEATGLPVFDVNTDFANLTEFDFLVLGSPVIYYKLLLHGWVRRHLASVLNRPTLLFSVSGAGAGAKVDGWMTGSLPAEFIAHADHVPLRGRQIPKDLTWYDRAMLIIGGLKNPDRKAGREEIQGFDYMDKSSIGPIVDWIDKHQVEYAAA